MVEKTRGEDGKREKVKEDEQDLKLKKSFKKRK
jgi:hypothetical protein